MEFVSYRRISVIGAHCLESMSMESQEQRIAAWSSTHEHHCIGAFADTGVSGRDVIHRPGIQAAVKLACRSKCALVVCNLSRLARSTKDALAIGEQLGKAGASLHSLQEALDSGSPTGRFIWTLLAAVAQWERETIADRTTCTMAFMRSKRLRISGKIPYGWALGPEGGAMVPVPEEQAVLARMLAWRKEGMGFKAIAARLTAEQVPTKSGNATWGAKVCRRIVTREARLMGQQAA